MPKILFLEDDEVLARVGVLTLQNFGYPDFTHAKSNAEALNHWHHARRDAKPYDLVIIDGGLPDGPGYITAATIRSVDNYFHRKRTPLLLLSAFDSDSIQEIAKIGDVDMYLQKPVPVPDGLINAIAYLLKNVH